MGWLLLALGLSGCFAVIGCSYNQGYARYTKDRLSIFDRNAVSDYRRGYRDAAIYNECEELTKDKVLEIKLKYEEAMLNMVDKLNDFVKWLQEQKTKKIKGTFEGEQQ